MTQNTHNTPHNATDAAKHTSNQSDFKATATATAATAATTPAIVLTPVQLAEQIAIHHSQIKANFNNKVDIKETKFHFRKVTDAVTKIETKRATVELPLPVLSVEGIIEVLEKGGKELELLQEAVAAVIIEIAREFVNNNEAVSATNFPYEMLSWETIANLPQADRRGNGIAKEVWEEFAADYIAIMPAVASKSKESVELAAKVFLTKFSTCKTNKPVLKLLKDQLALYINNTAQGEQFAACVAFLDNKVTELLATDNTNLLAAL